MWSTSPNNQTMKTCLFQNLKIPKSKKQKKPNNYRPLFFKLFFKISLLQHFLNFYYYNYTRNLTVYDTLI